MVTSPRIEQQQLSINKFSLNFSRYIPKNCSSNFTIYNTRCKVQEKKLGLGLEDEYMKDITPKNLFLKHQSKYLCCGLQNKIIKNPISRTKKFHAVEACKNHVSLDNSVKSVVFHHSGLLWWDRHGKWDFVYAIFSIAKAIVL